MSAVPGFAVIDAAQIQRWLRANAPELVEIVQHTYRLLQSGRVTNPDSYFLRFREEPTNRIIALPASLDDQQPTAGIKWISSFPDNSNKGLNRASAVLILNSRSTGYPFACLEGSLISTARTAASAVVGATFLHPTQKKVDRLYVMGCGPIAFGVVDLMQRTGWNIRDVLAADLIPSRSQLFVRKLRQELDLNADISPAHLDMKGCDMVLFATSAIHPHVLDATLFAHCPTVLHISLRDLGTEAILSGQNVADDVDHCLKANTSVHLTEQKVGHRRFMSGSIAQVMDGGIEVDWKRPRIFSPFGMGALDLAVARKIFDYCIHDSAVIKDFFPTPWPFSSIN